MSIQERESGDLRTFVTERLAIARTPGLAAAIVKRGRIAWTDTFGLRDVERELPVTVETPFLLASMTKPLTGAALLTLCERGLLDLDDDVARHLPFRLRNPAYPDAPITARMLLTHASGLRDAWHVDIAGPPGTPGSLYVVDGSTMGLEEFVRARFEPGGRLYDPHLCFDDHRPPGVAWSYCNHAFAVIALLVEQITGQRFADYCTERLFEPLGFRARPFEVPSDTAMPYEVWRHGTGKAIPIGHYRIPEWPAGQLRLDIRETARMFSALVAFGFSDDVRILSERTMAAIRERAPDKDPQDSGQGLVSFFRMRGDDELFGHTGGFYGAENVMFLRLRDGIAVVMLSNAHARSKHAPPSALTAFREIQDRLFTLGERL